MKFIRILWNKNYLMKLKEEFYNNYKIVNKTKKK